MVEIQSWDRVAVHDNVSETVEALLRGYEAPPELREMNAEGGVQIRAEREPARPVARAPAARVTERRAPGGADHSALLEPPKRVYPFGIYATAWRKRSARRVPPRESPNSSTRPTR